MEKFNLDTWLEDKSRKVVTRDGRDVEILKTNRKHSVHPIIFTIIDSNGIEQVHLCNEQGVCTTLPRPNKFDLFFADEEDELTEFEKRIYSLINFSDPDNFSSIEEVKEEAEILLDLARKELEKSKNFLAWPEKQGEQKQQGKPALEVWKDMRFEVYQQASGNRHEPNYSDDSTKMFSLTDIDEIFEKVAEKQGEHKPTDKVDALMSIDEAIEHCKEKSCGNKSCALEHKQLEKWLTELKELKEQKPTEWSEEDENMKSLIISTLTSMGTLNLEMYHHMNLDEVKKWLKSLKDRFQLHPEETEYISKEEHEKILEQAYKNADKVQFNRGMDEALTNPKKYFHVGDKIRLKNSNAEYIITSIFNGRYYGEGWSLDIMKAADEYELVEDCNEISDKIDYSSEVIGFLKNYIKAHGCTAMNSWVKWLEKKCNLLKQ